MKMAAPEIGNIDIPPEDNYTWRKYGQKEIMGSKYPRYVHIYKYISHDQLNNQKRKQHPK